MGQLYPPSQNWRPNAIPNAIPNDLYFSNKPELNLSTTRVGTLSFTTRGPSGTGMYIDWGDGSALEWIAHLGIGTSVVTGHNYVGAGTKNIKFTGRLDIVTYFLSTSQLLLYGDISEFRVLTSLTVLLVYSTSISGDISGLSGLTSLLLLSLGSTSVSGDISSISTLTNLTLVSLATTSVSGDIANISNLTSLVTVNLFSNSLDYNTTTLPLWNNNAIRIDSTTLTSTEVDNFLIDLAAAGGTNGTLNIAGTNAARTSASDAAKATLLANGWVITVNE